jgi:diacylglycerol kinase family enzyme
MAARSERLAAFLRQGGWSAELAGTVPGAGARPTADAAITAGYDLLIACGGDGTLSEIAKAVAMRGAAVTLAAVPWGTANIFAHAMGCPAPPERAARWLLAAQPKLVPLGRAQSALGTGYFLAVASVGLDADVVHRLRLDRKRRWGRWAYVAGAVRRWLPYYPAPLRYVASGNEAVADAILVGLTGTYAGRMRLGTVGDCGLTLVVRGGPWMLPLQALWLLRRGLEHAPAVERLPPGPVEITTPDLPLQLDGEPAGHTPVRIEVLPAAIRALA